MYAPYSYTAPRFTEEELKDQQASLSEAEAYALNLEKRGLNAILRESPERVARALLELQEALGSITDKEDYLRAMDQCPHLVSTESDPTKMLLVEAYDAQAAALRLTKYWKMRCKFFGERAFLPMVQTGQGALTEEDANHLRSGSIQMLPNDSRGRSVLLVRRSLLDHTIGERTMMVRNMFYMMSLACRDPISQKHGFVFLVDTAGLAPESFDRKMTRSFYEILRDVAPIQLRVVHTIFPCERCVAKIVYPLVLNIMGRSLRLRVCTHNGVFKEILHDLAPYGLTADGLPPQFGGTFDADQFHKLLQERRAAEEEQEEEPQPVVAGE